MFKKSSLATMIACILVLTMALTACNNSPANNSTSDDSSTGDSDGGSPAAGAVATRFEAEYATISGNVPGLVGVFFGASNSCMLEPADQASNGYIVANAYVEGNEDNPPSITFTITSDAEAEAQIILGVGCSWHMDESFNTIFDDTEVNSAYPLTANGTALTTTATVAADTVETRVEGDDIFKVGSDIIAADYGTITLKAGENTFTITGTAGSMCIDYLEIVTSANVTMEEDHTHTYRSYSEDDFEYIEIEV